MKPFTSMVLCNDCLRILTLANGRTEPTAEDTCICGSEELCNCPACADVATDLKRGMLGFISGIDPDTYVVSWSAEDGAVVERRPAPDVPIARAEDGQMKFIFTDDDIPF